MTIQVGNQAPDFTLFNSDKKAVSLADFKGKNLIIHFFPLAFTGTCTTQLCTMRDDLGFYKNLNAEVIGISVDSLFALGKYKEEQNYNFDLLSDFNKTVSEAYTGHYEGFMFGMEGVGKRAAFVIDPTGVVQYAEVMDVVGDLPNFTAIKAVLA